MRVHIPGFWPGEGSGPSSGKAMFCARLHRALEKEPDVRMVGSPERADVQLHVIRLHNKYRGCKNVLRLNGIYHEGSDYDQRNRPMRRALYACDGVVYQSQFSKHMCDRYLGQAHVPSAVILNGADPLAFSLVSPANVSCKHLFMTFSRWRPHKRLRDAIESFLIADIPDSQLFVAGKLTQSGLSQVERQRYAALPTIKFLGRLAPMALYSYLAVACGSMHLSPCDWCPNSVVEAVCCKVPVICSNAGGTREIVEPSGGLVCELDVPRGGRPVRLRQSPIDRVVVADALQSCLSPRMISCEHVDIRNIARQYRNFFEQVLS